MLHYDMKLPQDIKKHIRKVFIMDIIKCIALVAVFVAILLLWGDAIFNTNNKPLKLTCYIITLILPIFITGLPRKIKDKTYCGEVERVYISTTTDSSVSIKPVLENLYRKNTICLLVIQPDGKKTYQKVYEGKAKLQQNLDKYQKGDLVCHIYGSKHTIVLPQKNESYVECAICGDMNHTENNNCRKCGHSLIKHIEM